MSPLSPHLVCAGAAEAIEFYKRALGAVENMRQPVSERRRYSDGLLLARLKALKPELYRERKPAPVSNQRQITIVIRDAEAEELMLKLVRQNKLSPSDLPPALRARLRENPVLWGQRED